MCGLGPNRTPQAPINRRRQSSRGATATTPRRIRRTTSRAVARRALSPAASATWPHRSISCLTQRTKSPAVRSLSSSTSSRSSPSPSGTPPRRGPRSGRRRKSSRCCRSTSDRSRHSASRASMARRVSPPGIRGRHDVVGPARLVDERRQRRRQARRSEPVEHARSAAPRRPPGRARSRSGAVADRGRSPRRRRGSPASSSTSHTRSNWRATVLVRCSTRRSRVLASRSSLNQRSAQRAWSSRSGQSWQGCARSWARSLSTAGSSRGGVALALPTRRRRGEVVGRGAQRRGEVAPHLRVAGVEAAGQPEPRGGGRPGSGSRLHAEPSSLALGGQYVAVAARPATSPGRGRPRSRRTSRPAPRSRRRGGGAASECEDLLATVGLAGPRRALLELGERAGAGRRTP